MRKTYTVKQVAELLGYSTNSIYTFLQEGRIKGVRVGTGRFRIPEEEINRILHLAKKSEIIVTAERQPEKKVVAVQEQVELQSINPANGLIGLHIVNIFDWFIGAAAIVLGAALILYGVKKGKLEFAEFLPWLRTLEISFIAGGLGLTLTDLLQKRVALSWHKFFHLVLILCYGFFSYINLKTSDSSGFLLFGIITLISAVKFFIPFSGVKAFLLFLVLYGLGFGVEHMLGIPHPANLYLGEIFMDHRILFGGLLMVVVLVNGLFLFLGEKRVTVMFWVSMLIMGGGLILNSIFFANMLAWSMSFFLLISGLTCFLTPVWLVLRFAHENQRKTLVFTFGVMIAILLFGIAAIWIMQQNMAEYAARDLQSRLDFGRILVKEKIDSLEESLKGVSSNELLIASLKESNAEEMVNLLKLIYSNSNSIEKLAVLRTDGTTLVVYPYGEIEENQYSPDLYLSAINERKVYLFEDQRESDSLSGVARVGMSSPVIDPEGEIIAVLMVELDLIKVKNELQELANPDNDEYFLLYGKDGKAIVNRDKGINILTDSLGNGKLSESYNFQGQRVYEISERIEDLNWIIQINSSVDKIFTPTKIVSISIFLISLLFVGGITFWLVVEKRKYA